MAHPQLSTQYSRLKAERDRLRASNQELVTALQAANELIEMFAPWESEQERQTVALIDATLAKARS